MTSLSRLKRASQFPCLTRVLMETRELDARSGKMWARVAASGKEGMFQGREAVWVDVIVLPSGISTSMGVVVGRRFRQGLLRVRKWPVVPVSAIAVRVGGGYPGSGGGLWGLPVAW
jgi:hypothetical protein